MGITDMVTQYLVADERIARYIIIGVIVACLVGSYFIFSLTSVDVYIGGPNEQLSAEQL